MRCISRQLSAILVCTLSSFSVSPLFADALSQAVSTENKMYSAAASSQKKIDALDDRTRKMLESYRAAARQNKTLLTYNTHLQTLLASQEAEKTSLNQQLEQIDFTQREIVPLILNMQKSLIDFVRLDLPFLPKERQQRLQSLSEMMVRADVSNAEKFRRLIEAYQIENNYGNTIEAYRGNITLQGEESSVDFLRLGRVALYYQRLDGSETGAWDKKTKAWTLLDNEHRNAIRQGLRIARKETAPDLLTLPLDLAIEVK